MMRARLAKHSLRPPLMLGVRVGVSRSPSASRRRIERRAHPDGAPDLSGIWQANNTANWDLEPHEARQGPVVALAAAFSVPPGLGVVEGDEIPYLPAALPETQRRTAPNWMTLDPEIKCFMPGIPRATYMPYPFQIVQSADNVLLTYEFTSASRIVRMNSRRRAPRRRGWDGRSAGGTARRW